ncbi:type IX secretion system protein PorD [Flavobacterium ardleyense]|uniref:type IX secretion system protein PorD n=1 Tax=Flavobacterium ardleyense TaxID=2038737 RepID=UPI00298CED96|nr:DUF4835 family protein [Flavobacterium ardleyense]
MNKYFFIIFSLLFTAAQAQQLNCVVTVNSDKLGNADNQTFKTLETALTEFMNNTDWTGQNILQQERINCSVFINLSSYSSDAFSGTIQIQSARPIFNSTYSSPIFNYNDKDVDFRYVAFENLTFNPNSYDSNLVSLLAFYSYVMIGLDGDSFKLEGGKASLDKALDVAIIAQQGGSKGWSQADGNQNRYFLINDLVSPSYKPFRAALYKYHYEGLDLMNQDLKAAKTAVKESIFTLGQLHQVRPNAFLTRVFFDAKSDEIISIFSGGPSIPVADLIEQLNKVSPLNASKWGQIKL